jgi:hypothetical protein
VLCVTTAPSTPTNATGVIEPRIVQSSTVMSLPS